MELFYPTTFVAIVWYVIFIAALGSAVVCFLILKYRRRRIDTAIKTMGKVVSTTSRKIYSYGNKCIGYRMIPTVAFEGSRGYEEIEEASIDYKSYGDKVSTVHFDIGQQIEIVYYVKKNGKYVVYVV